MCGDCLLRDQDPNCDLCNACSACGGALVNGVCLSCTAEEIRNSEIERRYEKEIRAEDWGRL